MSSFKDLRIVDNFYQTSSFFPMPTLLISTLDEEGNTTCGSYSLCFPYYVAGKDYYAMILNCRNSSNTAQNILRTKKCALNFMPDKKDVFKEMVRLGFPGDTPKEKMKDFKFTLEDGQASTDDAPRPKVVKEAFQVFECTWDDSLDGAYNDKAGCLDGYEGPYHTFNGIISKFGCLFILKIDKILMKEKYYNTIINGVTAGGFPNVPVDYGYRDSMYFWCSKFKKPFKEEIPAPREANVNNVIYAADRIDPEVKFTREACEMMVKVPRPFLKLALQGCVNWAKENGVKLITPEHMKIINDKRSKEKGK